MKRVLARNHHVAFGQSPTTQAWAHFESTDLHVAACAQKNLKIPWRWRAALPS